jgi:hypothetical protein
MASTLGCGLSDARASTVLLALLALLALLVRLHAIGCGLSDARASTVLSLLALLVQKVPLPHAGVRQHTSAYVSIRQHT